MTNKVTEWCQYCECEVLINAEMVLQKCPNCGAYIVPCTMCDHNSCKCDLCKIGNQCTKLNNEIQIKNMEDKDLLTQIKEWANSSHAYLSNRTEYAKGYKDGISRAKEILLEIINSENK